MYACVPVLWRVGVSECAVSRRTVNQHGLATGSHNDTRATGSHNDTRATGSHNDTRATGSHNDTRATGNHNGTTESVLLVHK